MNLDQRIPYAKDVLFGPGGKRVYRGRELDQIAFPLGGIGTGMISLGGWGQLRDFEIFNRPNKNLGFRYTFFTLYARRGDSDPVTKVLQGPVGGDSFCHNGFGVDRAGGAGLAHFQDVKFTGAFPFARLDFNDSEMPLEVAMEAFNPFIPLKEDDSGLPAAMFNFYLTNPYPEPVTALLFANLENKTGYPEEGGGVIEYFDDGGARGLKMSTGKHAPDSPRFGTMVLATPHRDVKIQTRWVRGAWFDSLHRFWDEACAGRLEENTTRAEIEKGTDVGSISLQVRIEPGQSVKLPVWMVWHNPNFEKYWGESNCGEAIAAPVWKNYYATVHSDAAAVVQYIAGNYQRLENETRAFTEALFSSTLPGHVVEAVSSQISILKSTTCLRLEDGSFYAWEGCAPDKGCCEGSCTHVWNYAQALPYLFPALERSVREADYRINLHDSGHMTFRMPLPLGKIPDTKFHAAADGQLGGVMKVYRDWQICGDDDWLRKLWPKVQAALEYAWEFWDRDKDGVLEGVQHNTYDIEFYGPNTMCSSFYLGALRAAEEMARHLGEGAKADEYRSLFERGKTKIDASLFNGEYYFQDVNIEAREQSSHPTDVSIGGQDIDARFGDYPKYQYGKGCLSDHLIGQWFAHMLDLGYLLDPEHVQSSMASIFRYNWQSDLSNHANPQRIYALNDEAGLLLATWPHGQRPALPFVYSDEVWCGIEYQVAAHLIYEGMTAEGLAIVKGVRDRHDGVRRNPWNEFECGSHYARSMASYSLLGALSGFHYSAPAQRLSFAPRINADNFVCFFSVNSAWGMVRQNINNDHLQVAVEVIAGELTLRELRVACEISGVAVKLAGKIREAELMAGGGYSSLRFADVHKISGGEELCLEGRIC
ncbi:GH116 family glycosyl hydrolase [Planctomycetota bacterium]